MLRVVAAPLSFVAGASLAFLASGKNTAFASGNNLEAGTYPWTSNANTGSIDRAGARRGYQVYQQVCSTCHSLKYIAYRNLVGATHTEEQAKMIAKSKEVMDGPNSEGDMFGRPGKLSDRFVSPYPNEETARYANNGALPPDLSLMTDARMNGMDYIFSLLTGYRDPPAGVSLRSGLYYNPYMAGGAIAMVPPLSDGLVEYEDGTPATVSQMAKDVTTFLSLMAAPEHDERKMSGFKWIGALMIGAVGAGYLKRHKWSIFKNRKLSWIR